MPTKSFDEILLENLPRLTETEAESLRGSLRLNGWNYIAPGLETKPFSEWSGDEAIHAYHALETMLAHMVGTMSFEINGGFEPARAAWIKLCGNEVEDAPRMIRACCHPPTGVLLRPWLLTRQELQGKFIYGTIQA